MLISSHFRGYIELIHHAVKRVHRIISNKFKGSIDFLKFTFTRLADFPVAIFTITQKAPFCVLAFLSKRVAGIGGGAVAFIDIWRNKKKKPIHVHVSTFPSVFVCDNTTDRF